MPEGPEIAYCSVLLKKKLLNYKLTEIKSFTNKPVILPKDWDGKIIDIQCKGKILWLYVKGKKNNFYMHIHYGLTGWLIFEKPEAYLKFELIFYNEILNKEINIFMRDKRRFSKINIYTEEEHYKIINNLGIDLFSIEFTLQNFSKEIKKKNMLLAAFLLKQDIFSGIGNYIKNEVLYMGKLKVTIKTSELDNNQIKKLYDDILFVAYSNLIDMLSESKITKYLDKSKIMHIPTNLEIPYEFKIYTKDFTQDGKKVLKIKIAGRDTYCIAELC